MTPEQKAAAKEALIEKRDAEFMCIEKEKGAVAEAQKRVDLRIARLDWYNELIAEFSQLPNGSELPLDGLGKYSGMTTREGILDVLKQAGGGAMAPSLIARRLLSEGSKSTSKNFPTIVYAECRRLKKLGKLEKHGKGFRLRPELF